VGQDRPDSHPEYGAHWAAPRASVRWVRRPSRRGPERNHRL